MYDVTDIQGNSNLVRANVKFELSGIELLERMVEIIYSSLSTYWMLFM